MIGRVRRRRDRPGLARPAWHRRRCRVRAVLRVSRVGQAPARHAGRPARRSIPRYSGRRHRRGRHCRRPTPSLIVIGRNVASLRAEPGAHLISQISTTSPSECIGRLCTHRRYRLRRHDAGSVGGCRSAAVPGPDLHRWRDSSVGGTHASNASRQCASSVPHRGRSRRSLPSNPAWPRSSASLSDSDCSTHFDL